jgi:ubiquinone/menaquinone biosynthesis C-methylase UbiE
MGGQLRESVGGVTHEDLWDAAMSPYLAKRHYRGEEAHRYEALRTNDAAARRKWGREFAAIETIAASLPPASRVLDMPCGTGRFLPLLAARSAQLVGGDISLDMMRHAPLHSTPRSCRPGLVSCEAEQLPFRDGAFDYVLCMRFFNLVPPDVAAAVLKELGRVSRKGVFIQVRFLGRTRLLRIVPRAKVLVRRVMTGTVARSMPLTRGAPSQTGPKRFPLQSFERFVEMVRATGLAVARVSRIGPLFEPDPLTLCFLERR